MQQAQQTCRLAEQHASACQQQQLLHEEEVEGIRGGFEQAVQRLRSSCDEELDDLKAHHAAVLAALMAHHKEVVGGLQVKLRNAHHCVQLLHESMAQSVGKVARLHSGTSLQLGWLRDQITAMQVNACKCR